AFGTVGLSTAITSALRDPSKIVLILTMYTERVGAFTLLSIWGERPGAPAPYTEEAITNGRSPHHSDKVHRIKKKNESSALYDVIGLGRFGTALVKTLAGAGKEVIAIDKCEEKVREVRGDTDYAFTVDNLSEAALKETGIQNCDTVTVCIGEQVDM